MDTSTIKSLVNIVHNVKTEAPITFLIPTSLLRCSATNEARPRIPRHEIAAARIVKNPTSFPTSSSLANFLLKSSSTKLYSNAPSGLYFLNNAATFSTASDGFNSGLILSRTSPGSLDKLQTIGPLSSNGELIAMSFTTPITCKGFPRHDIFSPTAWSKPIILVAASLRITADVSDGNSTEKSRPSFTSHSTVLP